jgi:hypothetical protein
MAKAKMNKVMKKIKSEFNEKILQNIVSGILILIAISVPMMPKNVVSIVKNIYVRLVLMILIVGVCLIDPINALLLAIIFILAIQRYQSLNKSEKN